MIAVSLSTKEIKVKNSFAYLSLMIDIIEIFSHLWSWRLSLYVQTGKTSSCDTNLFQTCHHFTIIINHYKYNKYREGYCIADLVYEEIIPRIHIHISVLQIFIQNNAILYIYFATNSTII